MEESQYAQYSIHTQQEQIEKGKADERADIFINLINLIKKMKSEGKSNRSLIGICCWLYLKLQ